MRPETSVSDVPLGTLRLDGAKTWLLALLPVLLLAGLLAWILRGGTDGLVGGRNLPPVEHGISHAIVWLDPAA